LPDARTPDAIMCGRCARWDCCPGRERLQPSTVMIQLQSSASISLDDDSPLGQSEGVLYWQGAVG
jgi:hypothetical protein